MFHSRGRQGRDSRSSSTRSSYHTSHSSLEADDEIKTIIVSSSDVSEIPSHIFGQGSYSSERSSNDYGSHYSTAKSSLDSRYQSDTFYTATSHSERTDHSSSLYSAESDDGTSLRSSYVEEGYETAKDAERHFLQTKLRILEIGTQEISEIEYEEDKGCETEKQFVEKQIDALRQRQTESQYPRRTKNEKKKTKKAKQIRDHSSSSIPNGVIERLKIQNLLHRMKEISQAPVHEVDHCDSCRKVKERVTEQDFIRSKHRLVYNQLTEERYRQHIITHDPLGNVGNLASVLPKPSSNPKKIWNQLMQTGIT